MDRRGFLRGVALGTVAAGSTAALGPVAGQAMGREVASEQSYYPGTVYVEGTVLRRTADRVTIVDPETGLEELALSAKTSVWKGVDTTADVIAAGDHLSLRGYPLDNGVVDAVAIWVNIAWHRGTVTGTSGSAVAWTAPDGSSGSFLVAGHTTLHRGEAPAERFTGQLRPGHGVEALGAWDTPGGVFTASRIWIT